MRDISVLDIEDIKAKALDIFLKNKKIYSPIFGYVHITPRGFGHIEWKSKDVKRPPKEIYIRYACFLYVVDIISKL
jgi:hypothetical protein